MKVKALWTAFHEKALSRQGRFQVFLLLAITERGIGSASSAVLPCALFEELARAARCLMGSVQLGRCNLSCGLFAVSVGHGHLGQAIHRSRPDWVV